MCDPVTMTVVAAGSGLFQANAARQQGKMASAIANVNARNLENDAVEIRNKGVEEENAHRLKVARLASRQRAQFGASGVDLGSGSASLILEDTAELGEADALRIRTNYNDQADGLIQQADNTRLQGQLSQQTANNQAFGTLLNTGAQIAASPVASKWYSDSNSSTSGGTNDFVG